MVWGTGSFYLPLYDLLAHRPLRHDGGMALRFSPCLLVPIATDKGLEDVVYDVSFAFAFTAFYHDGQLHLE